MEPTGRDICCLILTRMDCMTDVHGAHPGLPGHTVLALRSSGVKAPPELSTPGSNQLQTPADHLGGNCKSNRPLILVEVHPLSFHAKQEATFLSAPPPICSLSFATPHPPFFFWLHSSHNRDGRTFPVAGGETEIQQERSKQDNNLHRFMCDSACTVLWSASWQTHKPAPSQLPPEYSGCL